MSDIRIVKATKDTKLSWDDLRSLLEQLTSSNVVFGEKEYGQLVSSESSTLFLMYSGETLIGMSTIATYLCPTGRKSWIEDVVIDQNYRGKGLGRRMLDYLLAYVQKQEDTTLMLTSRPSRVAANQLYQSLDFEKRNTNVYRIKCKK